MSNNAQTQKPNDELKTLSTGDNPHKAVILVGGIHDNYTYFDSWKDTLAAKDTTVMGFDHDHRSETMTKGAHNLAMAIQELKDKGYDEVTVIAHSMGGLVSKGALNELVSNGESQNFKHIDFHAFGTPWGGFIAGDLAKITPFSETISEKIGYPMGPEIGPHSDYMKGLEQKWPENMDFNVYKGTADNTATPGSGWTNERYEAIAGKADTMVVLEGFNHTDYRETGAEVLKAFREPVPGMDTVAVTEVPQRDSQVAQNESTHERGRPTSPLMADTGREM